MVANAKQSYDVTIECMIMGQTTKSTNSLDLKNPYFRYTGVQPPPPPGENNQSPSEAYWGQVDMQGARQVLLHHNHNKLKSFEAWEKQHVFVM